MGYRVELINPVDGRVLAREGFPAHSERAAIAKAKRRARRMVGITGVDAASVNGQLWYVEPDCPGAIRVATFSPRVAAVPVTPLLQVAALLGVVGWAVFLAVTTNPWLAMAAVGLTCVAAYKLIAMVEAVRAELPRRDRGER
ncbi:hypothetical protein EDD27_1470 [Nonomuraea polychroma]|uniref:Uncharacterized protein n=1 Tax=Nonomuraea polychroma TaxID=46176 RepID=A0A438M0I5_9ACTN|nr:hypothetical protein [Nonomuraea polychroma]RVX39127.1 hypothetical protein EDD27_1470 [Nonomuraea polychroma]